MKNEMMGENDLYLAPEETTHEAPAGLSADAAPEISAVEAEHVPEKVSRLEEIPEQRDVCRKVFRLADGTEQAVFSPAPIHVFDDETQTFEDMESTVTADDDGKHFTCGGNRFIARFSAEEDTDEIFSIRNGMHRVTLSARRNKKSLRHGVKPRLLKHRGASESPADTIAYPDIETGTDYEYSVAGDGVKEDIIVKKPAETYRYPFTLQCENVIAGYDEANKRIAFTSPESGEEVFYIPAPFMTDADGRVSTAVDYELRQAPRGTVLLTVTADPEWMNAPERAFPVTIDPQIKLSGATEMQTYSWEEGGLYASAQHTIGASPSGYPCDVRRMYMTLCMPTLPRNPRIKKAELVFSQYSGSVSGDEPTLIGLYRVDNSLTSSGNYPPDYDSRLIDYAAMKSGGSANDATVNYSFDITALLDQMVKQEVPTHNLVLKLMDEDAAAGNSITLHGSTSRSASPQIVVTYESSYGVNTTYRTHTHELGRFGQGSVDLQCGNLMFASEDFAWAGNRMPVTIRHLYNSALSGQAYTRNDAIGLKTADFSAMQIGHGFHLNLMQSVISASFRHEGVFCDGYVWLDENGAETYFRESTRKVCCESNSQCYALYEDVDGGGVYYDPVKRTLTQSDNVSLFDTCGRLIRVTDAAGNHMDIYYHQGRISTVTDGAGREFAFSWGSSGLASITAPDGTTISYGYTDGRLTSVVYPDGRHVQIAYQGVKPSGVTLQDASGATVYRVAYTFSGDRLTSVTEYGADDAVGAKSTFQYSIAAGRTIVTATEPKDTDEGETADPVRTTVCAFDDNGNIVSEYLCTDEAGRVGGTGEGGSLHPRAEDEGTGVVSNIANFLDGHSFENLLSWSEMPCNCGEIRITNLYGESYAKFGRRVLWMQSYKASCGESGMYQVTKVLPAGQYTFSAYLRVVSAFSGKEDPGAFLRVCDTDGNVLGVSEHLTATDTEYTRLVVPFTLESAMSVQVQILICGKGGIYADAAQLENNPYANAYNLMENGTFERETAHWGFNAGASCTTADSFNMGHALRIYGVLDDARSASQNVIGIASRRSTRETFTLSAWAKAPGLPAHSRDGLPTPQFRLRAVLLYDEQVDEKDVVEEYTADFCPSTDEWQFASVQFAKSRYLILREIRVSCDYGYNTGVAYFDDVQLIRNSVETGLSAADFAAEPAYKADTAANDADEASTGGDQTPAFTEAKDDFGNALTETTFNDGEFGTIYRAFRFNADNGDVAGDDSGNNLIEETDARGHHTGYTVDSATSRNEEVTDRLGNKTAYEYDASGRTAKVTSKKADGTELAHVSYAYDTFDNMTEIVRGDGMKYAFAYNEFHNLASIGIDGKPEALIRYTYKNGSGRLKQMTYANGNTMKAVYNSLGQMVAEKWFATEAQAADSTAFPMAYYKYVYDAKGNIVRSIDISGKKGYTYEYEDDKIIRATEMDITLSGEIVTDRKVSHTVRYYYDNDGKMTKKVMTPVAGAAQTIYYETNDSNTVVKFSAGGRTVTSHSKTDSFGRKIFDELQLGTDFVSRQFVYHAGKVTAEHKETEKVKSSATTQLVSQIILSNGTTLSYGYDTEERITSVVETYTIDGTPVTNTTLYTYDALGQLLTETVNGEVVNSMEYDNYGNITKKNGKVYAYGDAVWKDLLTGFDGKTIEYDAQGNPVQYLGHTLTWEKGRQLKRFDNIEYTYNANGIRTGKTVNGVLHTYTLDGTKILREVWGDNTLLPLYDNEDAVCGILYNAVPYYFVKNLQGDVIAVVDKDAQTVARYSYDAWGVCTVKLDSAGIAAINPFRYRGYYYDEEIGLYYLQSRYYDATLGRFSNADSISNIGFIDTVLTNNIFAFCNNNSINETDVDGAIVGAILKVIGRMLLYAAAAVGVQYLTDQFLSLIYRKTVNAGKNVYISVGLQGAIDGFWNSGFIGDIMKSVIGNLIKQFIDIVWNGKKFEPTQLCDAIFDGIMSGVLSKLSIKKPKYIRDIKKKARQEGIKGTKKLVKYLSNCQIKVRIWNFGLKQLKDFCYNVLKNITVTLMSILREIVHNIINAVSARIKEARA